MKSVKIDDADFEHAARVAAARGVSVEELIRELLARETAPAPDAAAEARRRMGEMARATTTGSLGGWKWNREELYEERLSRHECPDIRGDRHD
jgi:hypothetical protein